jgi:ATP-dependent RNA helicase RhlB
VQAQGSGQNAGRPPARHPEADKRGSARHSPAPAPHGEGGGLLSRIGRGLRSLVTRAPRSQH